MLHVLRFRRGDLDRLIEDINATGYGLTFGLHTRIDETIARVVTGSRPATLYQSKHHRRSRRRAAIRRVWPVRHRPKGRRSPLPRPPLGIPPQTALRGLDGAGPALATARAYADWLRENGREAEAERVVGYLSRSALGAQVELPGPVRRTQRLRAAPARPCGGAGQDGDGAPTEVGAILATGNTAVLETRNPALSLSRTYPAAMASTAVGSCRRE